MAKSTFRFHAVFAVRVIAICILGTGALCAGQTEFAGAGGLNITLAFTSDARILSYEYK